MCCGRGVAVGRGAGWCGAAAAWQRASAAAWLRGGGAVRRRCVGAGCVAWQRASAARRAPFPAAAKSLTTKNLLERESANFADSLSSISLSHSNLAAAHSITIRHNHTPATQHYLTTATHQQHTGNNTNTPTTPRDHTKPRAPNPLTHSYFLKTNRPISPICFQHLADTQPLNCPATKSEYVKICPATRSDQHQELTRPRSRRAKNPPGRAAEHIMYHHVTQRRLLEIKQPSLRNSQYHNNLPSTAKTIHHGYHHSLRPEFHCGHHNAARPPSRHGHRCAFVAQGWPGGGVEY